MATKSDMKITIKAVRPNARSKVIWSVAPGSMARWTSEVTGENQKEVNLSVQSRNCLRPYMF